MYGSHICWITWTRKIVLIWSINACLASWNNYRIVCDYFTKKHRFGIAFVLSGALQKSHRFSPKPPPSLGCFPITSLAPPHLDLLSNVVRLGSNLLQRPRWKHPKERNWKEWTTKQSQEKIWTSPDQMKKKIVVVKSSRSCGWNCLNLLGNKKVFHFSVGFTVVQDVVKKGLEVPPTKPRSESPTFFFQEGEMKVASHFSGKARGKSSRSLAFHTHFTPKGIPGANGSWTNMRLAPFLTHLWRRGVSLPVRLASFRVFNYPTIRTGLLGFTLLGRHKRNAWNQQKKLSKLKWEKNSSSQQSDTSNLPDLEHSFYILPLLWLNWVENNANSNHLNHSPAWSPHDFPHLFWTRNNPESSIENDCFTVLRLFQILARCMILIVGFHSKIIFWYLTLVGYKVPGRFGVRPPLPQDQNHLKEIKDSLQKNGLVSIKSSLNWVLKLALLLYFFRGVLNDEDYPYNHVTFIDAYIYSTYT